MGEFIPGDKQSFIDTLMPHAMQQSARTGVDPRIIIAQAAQETGWGKHVPGGNLFGIKSHGKSGGKTYATKEVYGGKTVGENASFRQFGSVADAVAGYGDFLLENPRYSKMRSAQNLEEQAAALQASGYATDPNYGQTVLSIARGITPGSGRSDYADYAKGSVSNGYGRQGQTPAESDYASYARGSVGNGGGQQQAMSGQNALAMAPPPPEQSNAMAGYRVDPAAFKNRAFNALSMIPVQQYGGPNG